MPVARDVNNHTIIKKTCALESCWSVFWNGLARPTRKNTFSGSRRPKCLQKYTKRGPKSFQTPPKTFPNTSKIHSKTSPGGSKRPFGERSEYKPQKMMSKSGPRDPKSLQTPSKALPKPSKSPPNAKIHGMDPSKKRFMHESFYA